MICIYEVYHFCAKLSQCLASSDQDMGSIKILFKGIS
jgi:hypothetical protein